MAASSTSHQASLLAQSMGQAQWPWPGSPSACHPGGLPQGCAVRSTGPSQLPGGGRLTTHAAESGVGEQVPGSTYLSQVEAKATLRHIHPEPSLLSSSGLSPLLWPFVREAWKPVGPGDQLSRSGQGSAGRPKPSRARATVWAPL